MTEGLASNMLNITSFYECVFIPAVSIGLKIKEALRSFPTFQKFTMAHPIYEDVLVAICACV